MWISSLEIFPRIFIDSDLLQTYGKYEKKEFSFDFWS